MVWSRLRVEGKRLPPPPDFIRRAQVPGDAARCGPDGDAVVRPFGSGPVDACLLGAARPPGLHGECGASPPGFLCSANLKRGKRNKKRKQRIIWSVFVFVERYGILS